MTVNPTTLEPALKEIYDDGVEIERLVYDADDRPLMTYLNPFTDFGGKQMPFPILVEDVGGDSATFDKAQTNALASAIGVWDADVTEGHSVSKITTQAIKRARNRRGSFLEGLKHLVDSTLNRRANSIESQLFRKASGSIGTIGTIVSTTITLDNTADIVNFFVGQVLVAAADTSSALQDSGGTATVTEVDRDAGTVEIDANPGSWADTNLLFQEGDYTAADDELRCHGLQDLIPTTVASIPDLYGQTRSTDPTRYAGIRVTGSTSAIENSAIDATVRMFREGKGRPDAWFLSPIDFGKLLKEMGVKVDRPQADMVGGGRAVGSFKGVDIYCSRSVVKAIPATYCPDGHSWLGTQNKSWLLSMDEPVQIDDEDGKKLKPLASSSGYELRVVSWVNPVIQRPTGWGYVSL